ncbi:MAG: glycosyltransferase [Planctomycetota bacterium]
MKIALVTTPPTVRSGIADYTRRLLPYLREHADVELFVEHGAGAPEWGDERARSVLDLDPRRHDQIVYQLGNELSHGFMARMVRAIGGTVVLHDWVLFDLAVGGFPALIRGGWKGHALALREGGADELRVYARNWLDRRRQRAAPLVPEGVEAHEGPLLAGWHEPEPRGRWTADAASFRLPGAGIEEVQIEYEAERGRAVRLRQGPAELATGSDGRIAARPGNEARPVLVLETAGIRVTREQRRHGDPRRIGCYVTSIRWRDGAGWHALDLGGPVARPIRTVHLTRDRFRLALNRSVVRFADALLVHSRHVKELVLRERNAATAIGVVPHGAERRWSDEDRRERRRAFGLSPAWVESFLVTSFGGVQPHKRIEQALAALALARRTHPDIRMVLAGSLQNDEFDPVAEVRRLSLADAVRCPGFVPEADGWGWLHAGDVALNLRGPSTGGTSGGIFQAFSAGRAVIASDAAEQRELPDSCTVKVPLGAGEVETLARILIDLRNDPARLARLEAGAREFVERECHWSIVARRYAELLESFPRPRIPRGKLVALRVRLLRNTRAGAGGAP